MTFDQVIEDLHIVRNRIETDAGHHAEMHGDDEWTKELDDSANRIDNAITELENLKEKYDDLKEKYEDLVDELDTAIEEKEEAIENDREVGESLAELVRLYDYKQIFGKDHHYNVCSPVAWKKARRAIGEL